MTENSIPHLLKLAGILSSIKAAVACLSAAIAAARTDYEAAKNRPLPGVHNDLLADIEKGLKKLTKAIGRLRRHPATLYAFWRSSAFGPVRNDRVEVREVLTALESISNAAAAAKNQRKGRRREVGKQHVVDHAVLPFSWSYHW